MNPAYTKRERAIDMMNRTHIANRDNPNPRTERRAQRALRLYWVRWVAFDMQCNPHRYAFPVRFEDTAYGKRIARADAAMKALRAMT